jgi:hypothetical protein
VKALSDAQYALKAAVRRAVKMAGGCNAATDTVRVDAPRLSRYGNVQAPEFAPIDVCVELDRAAGDPVILRAWADLMGLDLLPRDQRNTNAVADVTRLAGGIALEAGELISTTIKASADRVLTPNEGRAIDEAAADLQEKVVDLRVAARRSIKAG